MSAIKMRLSGLRPPRRAAIFVPVAAAFLSACSVGPSYQEPDANLPFRYSGGSEQSADLAAIEWWRGFNDPVLDDLVAQGEAQNLDVLAALERVRAADAVARGSGATVNVDGTATSERLGGSDRPTFTQSVAGIGVSWIIDLFGGSRSEKEAALRDLEAAEADADAARMLYLSRLATAYVDLRFFEASIQLRREDLVSRRETADQIRARFQANAGTQLDVAQAEALITETLADIPVLEANAQRQRNRIATLLGKPAGAFRIGNRSVGRQPVPARVRAAGVPADLVRNRPDIRRAERIYASAVSDIGVARAQLYPSLTLDGNISINAIDSNGGDSWGFGPTLNVPIFNQGVLQANVDVAESQARQEFLAWRNAVLNGVEEVESALFSVGKFRTAVSTSRELVASYERALGLYQELSQSREVTSFEVIDAERQVADARETLAQNLRQLGLEYVALNVALGAGYAASGSGGS